MDIRVEKVFEQITEMYKRILGDSLVGIYAHGSYALGSFHWERSDIDFFVIVNRALTIEEKTVLMKELVKLHNNSNPKGLEMSVVLEKYTVNPTFPTPFELHFSNGTLDWYMREPDVYVEKMVGEDKDLGSYMAVIKQSGIVLYGKPIDIAIGKLPKNMYFDSVIHDIKDAKEEYSDNYSYHTLNLCRSLAYLQDGVIRSKQRGGEWGLANAPERFRELIRKSLAVYCEGADVTFSEEEAKAFADYAFDIIRF